MIMHLRLLSIAACSALVLTAHAQEPSATAAPEASPKIAKAQPVGDREITTRLQIFLDQQNFGPGIIDGRMGEFTKKALAHYAIAHKLQNTPNLPNELPLDTVYPIYTEYTISDADAKNVGEVPSQPSEQAKLKRMAYASLLEFIEERYHAHPDFLRKLNPGKNLDALKPGDTVRVPNVAPFKIEEIKPETILPERPDFLARSIYISTKDKMLDLYDGNALIASFPITPGSTTLPAPPGKWSLVVVATLPWFRWDEEMLQHGRRSDNYFNIPPGPNNPVGVLWAGVEKKGIGLHGTNVPETIGRAASHGCIRLANWDAIKLAGMITKKMPVTIE
jgi:lipoprotein-anchoring transpeptidase ErfK/SrfK